MGPKQYDPCGPWRQHYHLQGAWKKCTFPGPPSDLLHQSLSQRVVGICAESLFSWFLCTLTWENHWSRAHTEEWALLRRKEWIGKGLEVLTYGEMRQDRFHQKTFAFHWNRSEVTAEHRLHAFGPSEVLSPTLSLHNLHWNQRLPIHQAPVYLLAFLVYLKCLPAPLNVL